MIYLHVFECADIAELNIKYKLLIRSINQIDQHVIGLLFTFEH